MFTGRCYHDVNGGFLHGKRCVDKANVAKKFVCAELEYGGIDGWGADRASGLP